MKITDRPNYKSLLKKIFITVFTLFILSLVMSCGSGSGVNNNQTIDLSKLTDLIENRSFEIQNQWALPLRGGRIDLIGNPNFLRIKGDSADVNLPYFGVRQMGGGYGDRGGIIFNGPIKDVQLQQDENGKSLMMNFKASQGNENLEFYITMFPNNRTDISVNSTQRDAISYQGSVKPYEEKKK